jgi:hypothetical protein
MDWETQHGEVQAGGMSLDGAWNPQQQRREVDARLQAVSRLRRMNLQHAKHAWDLRHSDPIAPYALAFLFAQPGAQNFQVISAATKLWLAGPEAADLPRLLFDLNQLVISEFHRADFDPRLDLADRTDPGTNDDAWYFGLAVSSLDTHTGSWQETCQQVTGSAEIPGVVRIVMVDGSIIVLDRRGLKEFNELRLRATDALATSRLQALYPWSFVAPDTIRSDPEHGEVLRWMEELNLNLWRLDNARLDRLRDARGPGGGPMTGHDQ